MLEAVKVQTIKAVIPISILVKIVERLDRGDGVDPKQLFQVTHRLAREHGVYLYDFDIDYKGNLTSLGFWRDVRRMISWGYAREASPNISLTDDGKEFAGWLVLEAPVKAALDRIVPGPES